MEELPTSIREEVEEYLKHPPPTTMITSDVNRNSIAEKSFTQVMDHIDEAVLNELPPEMRREISIAQKLRKIESKYPPIGGKRLVPISIPSNSTTKEKNNAFNVLMNSPQKQPPSKKTGIPMKKWRTETILRDDTNVPTVAPEVKQPNKGQQQPSIAGCTSLTDVKLMLREWIESSAEPDEFDLNLFQNYLIDLLNNYNAEMVQQLLTYGLLQLKTSMKANWNEKFQIIIDAVQLHFSRMYGGAKMDLS